MCSLSSLLSRISMFGKDLVLWMLVTFGVPCSSFPQSSTTNWVCNLQNGSSVADGACGVVTCSRRSQSLLPNPGVYGIAGESVSPCSVLLRSKNPEISISCFYTRCYLACSWYCSSSSLGYSWQRLLWYDTWVNRSNCLNFVHWFPKFLGRPCEVWAAQASKSCPFPLLRHVNSVLSCVHPAQADLQFWLLVSDPSNVWPKGLFAGEGRISICSNRPECGGCIAWGKISWEGGVTRAGAQGRCWPFFWHLA